jgi:hypothetical protein
MTWPSRTCRHRNMKPAHLMRPSTGKCRILGYCTFGRVLESAVVDGAQNLGLQQEIAEACCTGRDVTSSRLSGLGGSAILLLWPHAESGSAFALPRTAPGIPQTPANPCISESVRNVDVSTPRPRYLPVQRATTTRIVPRAIGSSAGWGAAHLVRVGVVLWKVFVSHLRRMSSAKNPLSRLDSLDCSV